MFNLIAQYIGYSTDAPAGNVSNASQNLEYTFGEAEEGDWTLVEVKEDCNEAEEEFQRIPSPSPPIVSLQSSTREVVDVPIVSAVSQISSKRVKCPSKNNKRQWAQHASLTQHRPNQMKRSNQVLCSRGNKVFQKMRQIVHQPRKF